MMIGFAITVILTSVVATAGVWLYRVLSAAEARDRRRAVLGQIGLWLGAEPEVLGYSDRGDGQVLVEYRDPRTGKGGRACFISSGIGGGFTCSWRN